MKLSLIVAMAEDGAIGLNNQLPWHISEDLKNFKKITMGKPILMGRKTWESLGRPLPGRENVVLSSTTVNDDRCTHYQDIASAMKGLEHHEEVMLIGGASLYEQLLPEVEQLYVTWVEGKFEADTYFPELSWADWNKLEDERFEATERRPFAFSFRKYQRSV